MNGLLHISLLLILVFSLVNVHALALISRLIIHVFLLGFFARTLILPKGENPLFESLILSIALSSSIGLLLGNFLMVASFYSRLFFVLIILVLYAHWIYSKKTMPNFLNSKDVYFLGILLFLCLLSLGLLFLLNPTIALLSDGWWHCPVFNTIDLGTLPPQNPWMAGVPLAYPYSYHVFLKYSVGDLLPCVYALDIFSVHLTFLSLFAVYLLAKEIRISREARKTAFFTAFIFMFISTIGGVFFLYDAITALLHTSLSDFLIFLKSVHGPHMWYSAMKFMGISGIGVPFQSSAMVGFPQLAYFFAVLYFAIRRNQLAVSICLAPLISNNTIIGIVAALTVALFFIMSHRTGVIIILRIALISFLINLNYFLALLSKLGNVGASIFGFSKHALPVFVGFLVAYSPLIIISLTNKNRARYSINGRLLLMSLLVAYLIVHFFFNLVYLYVSMIAFFLVAVSSAEYFTNITFSIEKTNIGKFILLALLSIPILLIISSYIYYSVNLSQDELEASFWLEKNTPKNSVILSSLNFSGSSKDESAYWVKLNNSFTMPSNRQLHIYCAVFGKRLNYLGDLQGLLVYGENFIPRVNLHNQVFVNKNISVLCSLKSYGIDYVYDSYSLLGNPPCLDIAFNNTKVTVYKTK